MQTEPDIHGWIMDRVSRAMRIPLPQLEKEAASNQTWKRKEVRRAVRNLVDQGSLMYTNELGTSFLEECYTGASRLGKHIVGVPPGFGPPSNSADIHIVMKQGASFGSGRHPTTRLAVRAIEKTMGEPDYLKPLSNKMVVDIGTGTGILALAALKLGMEQALCTDIDPCALFETRENAALNGMAGRLSTGDIPVPSIPGNYALVLANLRLPTLLESMDIFARLCSEKGHLIVSGIHPHETDSLNKSARQAGFTCLETSSEQDWAAMILQKTP